MSQFNEVLIIRPYGLLGLPFAWSSQTRIIQNKLPKIENVFANIKNIIQEWCSIEAGTLPKPEFLIQDRFDEEFFTDTRERQLGTILSQEIIDNEENWTNYEAEEAQVKLDIADMLLDQLVNESVQCLNFIDVLRSQDIK